jgi:hypothetical protein
MVEGFWILQIKTPQFVSGGVVVFVGSKIFGGDNGFTWMGTYQESGNLVKARVAVHKFDATIESIMVGVPDDYEMQFSGNVEGDVITGTAIVSGQPQYSLGILLSKKANL